MAEYVTGPGGSGVGPGPFDPESSMCFEQPASVVRHATTSDRRVNRVGITETFVAKRRPAFARCPKGLEASFGAAVAAGGRDWRRGSGVL